MTSNNNWIESLNVGDKVIVSHIRHKELTKVEKVTPTQIITKHGLRFRRTDGRRIGGHGMYSFAQIVPLTKKSEDEIVRAESIGYLTRLEKQDLEHLSTEQLTSFLEQVKNKEPANVG